MCYNVDDIVRAVCYNKPRVTFMLFAIILVFPDGVTSPMVLLDNTSQQYYGVPLDSVGILLGIAGRCLLHGHPGNRIPPVL